MASETIMGTHFNAQDDHNSKYVSSINLLIDIIVKRVFSPFLSSDVLYPFSITYWREKFTLKAVHTYTRSIIANRKQELLRNIREDEDSISSRKDEKKTKNKMFLDLLLDYSQSDNTLTDEQIREEIDTVMYAVGRHQM